MHGKAVQKNFDFDCVHWANNRTSLVLYMKVSQGLLTYQRILLILIQLFECIDFYWKDKVYLLCYAWEKKWQFLCA